MTTIVAVDPIEFVFDASESDYLRYNRMNASGERPTSRDTAESCSHPSAGRAQFRTRRQDGLRRQPGRSGDRDDPRSRNHAQSGRILAPGQFGRLMLLGSGELDAVLVPDSAILSDQSLRFVWVMGKDDIPERRAITPGNLERGLRVVRSGLQRDDQSSSTACSGSGPEPGDTNQRPHRNRRRQLGTRSWDSQSSSSIGRFSPS